MGGGPSGSTVVLSLPHGCSVGIFPLGAHLGEGLHSGAGVGFHVIRSPLITLIISPQVSCHSVLTAAYGPTSQAVIAAVGSGPQVWAVLLWALYAHSVTSSSLRSCSVIASTFQTGQALAQRSLCPCEAELVSGAPQAPSPAAFPDPIY